MLCLLAACGFLSACDGSESTSTSEDYEKALFMAYATTRPSEYMHGIAVADIVDLINALELIVADAYTAGGNDMPAGIDLSATTSDDVTVPDGMTGTITQVSSLGMKADVDLDDCILDSDPDRAYTGAFTGSFTCTVASDVVTIAYMTFSSPGMLIRYNDKDYRKAIFSDFSLDLDNSGTYPAYTIGGTVTIDGTSYSFDDFFFQKTSSTYLNVSGVVSFDDVYIGVYCDSVKINASSGLWTSGDLTLTYQDSDGTLSETATAELSGSTVSFEIASDDSSDSDGDTWDWEDWYAERLVP